MSNQFQNAVLVVCALAGGAAAMADFLLGIPYFSFASTVLLGASMSFAPDASHELWGRYISISAAAFRRAGPFVMLLGLVPALAPALPVPTP